jgi:hypothetical protein
MINKYITQRKPFLAFGMMNSVVGNIKENRATVLKVWEENGGR